MNDVAQRIQNLSPARQKLLERLNAGSGNAAAVRSFPLSHTQRGMWFVEQLEPDGAMYNMPFGSRYIGALDEAALWWSIEALVQRHDALRTIIPSRNGVAIQEVLPTIDGYQQTVDLSDVPVADREARLAALIHTQNSLPFDLTTGPLIRVVLFRVSAEDRVLYFNMHHIISDGWSAYLLQRELDTLYQAYIAGERVPSLPPVLQYGDYTIWQRGWMNSDAMQRQLGFWREQLAGVEELILPTDRPRPAVLTHRAGHLGVIHSEVLSHAITRFCKAHSVTPFMALLAAFQCALARYLSVDDFTVGTATASRNRVELEGVVGCFVNTLVLRSDVAASTTFRELVGRVRERTLSAYEHQDIPYERLVEELVKTPSLSQTPLFQVVFAFQNYPASKAMEGLQQTDIEIGQDRTKIELTLTMAEQDGIYRSEFEYDLDLYEEARMRSLLAYFEQLMQWMVEMPDAAFRDCPLPAAERERLRTLGTGEVRAHTPPAFIDTFTRQARSTPDAVAVEADDQSVDYASLDAHSDRIAGMLRAHGVGPDVAVGVLMPRGVNLIASLLAIFKAGGVYVPLDHALPPARLQQMVDQVGLRVLVHAAEAAPAISGNWAAVQLLAELPSDFAGAPRFAACVPLPGQLAYVTFTSGSTGEPKPVGVTHDGLASQLQWIPGAFGLDARTRFLHKTSIGFDASLGELLAPLLCGGTVVMARPGGEFDPQYLVDLVAERRVSVIDGSPSLLQAMLSLLGPGQWPSVKQLVCGGEPLGSELARRVHATLPGVRLFNAYGPTETTIQSTWAEIDEDAAGIAIGCPVPGTTLSVLDAAMRPVPAGTRGELYIGGIGVARGYLGRAALTAERFLPDAQGRASQRCYRTGDMVRWREDAQLEFLGRSDRQVKLRGYRIELDEIERTLLAQPGVRQAVVVVREDAPGLQQLVAYVRATSSAVSTPARLREALLVVLPRYMVPAAFVALDAIPQLPNGKLDRSALPVPDAAAVPRQDYQPPQGELEQQLALIFAAVLRQERIGRDDSFFAMGGHSLLAVQLVSRVQRATGLEFRLVDLFAQPTVRAVARILRTARQSQLPPLVTAARGQALPLSHAQQRLWFLDQLDGVDSAYNIPLGLTLNGALDRTALQRALDTLVARHEVLRTHFVIEDDMPLQRITPAEQGFALRWHALDGGGDAPAALRAHIQDEAVQPFDLATGPLFRGRLLRLDSDTHVLLLTLHHSITDGWSIGVLWSELRGLYAAFHQGRPNPLPPLALQYADYALWQAQVLQGSFLQEQTDYWRSTLAGAPACLALPLDRPRPAQQDFAGDYVELRIDAALTLQLRALGQRHGTTLYMTLLAAWSMLLSRLCGEHDVVVGTPTANRPHEELEALIGFFTNMLALRVDLADDPDVPTILNRVRSAFLGAQAHEHLPFEQVVAAVRPERSAAYSPLFQVMLSWQSGGDGNGGDAMPGLTVGSVDMPASRKAKFDLTLTLEEQGDTIGGGMEFATALFDRASIERHLGCLYTLLQAMVAQSEQRLSELPLLTPAQRQAVLEVGDTTSQSWPFIAVHQQIQSQARLTPSAVAVRWQGQTIDYSTLNKRANQLARVLQQHGAGPQQRVALCVSRRPTMLLALLAVLKAGASYVPLDPAYPPARLRQMLHGSRPAVLLAEAGLLPSADLSAWSGQALDLAQALRDAEAMADGDPPDSVDENALAYVIYTSGSTGQPKGVMLQHGNLAAFLAWGRSAFTPEQLARTLAATSLSFDLAVFECLLPLTCGGSVELVDSALDLAGADAATLQPTLINTVPSVLEAVLEVTKLPSSVRVVNLAGEPLKPALVERIFRTSPVPLVCNLYGPTETTTYSTHAAITREQPYNGHIGRPISNTRLYILDARGEPVPAGVAGEIHIGGAGVAQGYFEQPERTEERFVPDPFATSATARRYRTGDLGRWRNDGTLEYLGRSDHQVKLRGYRIELGEIEQALTQHPGIRQAAVVLRHDLPNGQPSLVAYVVGDEGSAPLAAVLTQYLAERLPGYMVPPILLPLQSMPVTPNGKLDRAALPVPQAASVPMRGDQAPQGELEQQLAAIFAQLLRRQAIGRDEDFFELGGHSLLAVQLVSRVQRVTGLEFRLVDLFTQPTVRATARILRSARQSRLPALIAATREGALPLSHAQQRLWFLDQLEGVGAAYNVPLSLRLEGALDRGALQQALDTIVARHEVLRTRFVVENDVPLQKIDAQEEGFALHWYPLHDSTNIEDAVRAHALDEATQPFDLASGPLFRGRLIGMGRDTHVLLLTMHHSITDGWSMGVLLSELECLYAAFRLGQPNPLPELGLQYADYALWQAQVLQGPFLKEQTDYWRNTLTGAPGCLALPLDRPRPALQDFSGDYVEVRFDAELTAQLRALAQRHGTTLYLTLLTAWSMVLSRTCGQDDIVIGTPTANRPHEELESLIGFFTNMLALRVNLADDPDVATLLGRVRDTFLGAQAHEHLPFEQVVATAQPERSAAYSPLFQVMLSWEDGNAGDAGGGLPGLSVSSVDVPSSRQAKFDLTLTLQDDGDTISGGMEFATALFDRISIERHLQCLHTLLQAMVAQEEQRMSQLPLLTEAQRRQVLDAGDTTARSWPFIPAHLQIQEQVQRTPSAPAVHCKGQSLDYATLNRRANQLARYLQQHGVGPEQRVALCVTRSSAMVLALLAVLKTGAAYVPLDPAYPPARLQQMLLGSVPRVLLTEEGLMPLVDGSSWTGQVLDLAKALAAADALACDDLPGDVAEDAVAYLIHTSGSTGMPKGVMLQHGNLAAFLAWGRSAFTPEQLRRTLAATSFSFDLSVFECLLPLTCGGCIELVDSVLDLASPHLADLEPTLINTVPSALEALLEVTTLPDSVQVVNLAGEALNPSLVSRIFHSSQVPTVCNLYGPTETTTYSTHATIHRGQPYDGDIGRPIANTRIYVLDAQGEPVPVGVSGEIYIGGAGVALGYFEQPERTQERFLADPFSAHTGARMYRTGDVGRWRNNGTLEYLGRSDQQIKLRGYRIELGEIEHALTQHPDVRQAAVLLRTDLPSQQPTLVAYVVPESGSTPSAPLLSSHLLQRLPGFMVPPVLLLLTRLPVTPNGKLDRSALPLPDTAVVPERADQAPQGKLEQQLARIFAELLQRESVGRDDNFFDLGGHSLLAVRLLGQIRRRLRHSLPLAALFNGPTVAQLAQRCRHEADADSATPAVLVTGRDRSGVPLFLIHPIGGHVLCYRPLAAAIKDSPVYALAADGDALVEGAPTLEAIASRHLARLLDVQPQGPYRVGGWSFGGLVAWEIARQLRERGQDVIQIALLDTYPPAPVAYVDAEHRERAVFALLQQDLGVRREADWVESARTDDGLDTAARLAALGLALDMDTTITEREGEFGTDLNRLYQLYDRHVAAMEGYVVQATDAPVCLVVARNGHSDWLRAAWTERSRGGLAVLAVPGGHFDIVTRENANAIASHLRHAENGGDGRPYEHCQSA